MIYYKTTSISDGFVVNFVDTKGKSKIPEGVGVFAYRKVFVISYNMDISFNELQKRDVINVTDGKCLGRVSDLVLKFPEGVMTGIYVPGKRQNFIMRIFSRAETFIDRSRIIKIGNDVILVDIRCGDTCGGSVAVDRKPCPKPPKKPTSGCGDLFGGASHGYRGDCDDE